MQRIWTRAANTLILLLVVAAALSWATAPSAHAAQRDEVIDAILADGYYVEAGSVESPTEVADALRTIRRDGFEWALVVLADEPAGSSTQFAADLLSDLAETGSPVDTVLVKSPVDVGADSFVYESSELDVAFDESLDAFRQSGASGFTAFATQLSPGGTFDASPAGESVGNPNPILPSSGEASSGLGSFLAIIAAPIAAVFGGLWFFGRRRKRKAVLESSKSSGEVWAAPGLATTGPAVEVGVAKVDRAAAVAATMADRRRPGVRLHNAVPGAGRNGVSRILSVDVRRVRSAAAVRLVAGSDDRPVAGAAVVAPPGDACEPMRQIGC